MYNIKAMILTSSVCSDMHVRRSASVQVLGALQKAETNMAVQPTVDRGDYEGAISESFVYKSDPSQRRGGD